MCIFIGKGNLLCFLEFDSEFYMVSAKRVQIWALFSLELLSGQEKFKFQGTFCSLKVSNGV